MEIKENDPIETIEHAAIVISGLALQGRIVSAPEDHEAETMLALLTILVKKQEPK